jgi:luciferase family oxidoreductase group 1
VRRSRRGRRRVAPHSLGLTRKTTTVQATTQSLPISVLDLVPTRPGQPARWAIARTVELARHVEQLGYKRYWVAEHHAIQGLACSATPMLIGHIAAATKTIRVGSGGVILPSHATLVVAEQFGTLEAIYPGRIDLAGCGKTRFEASAVPQNSLVSTTQPDKRKVCVDKTSSSWMCSAT